MLRPTDIAACSRRFSRPQRSATSVITFQDGAARTVINRVARLGYVLPACGAATQACFAGPTSLHRAAGYTGQRPASATNDVLGQIRNIKAYRACAGRLHGHRAQPKPRLPRGTCHHYCQADRLTCTVPRIVKRSPGLMQGTSAAQVLCSCHPPLINCQAARYAPSGCCVASGATGPQASDADVTGPASNTGMLGTGAVLGRAESDSMQMR